MKQQSLAKTVLLIFLLFGAVISGIAGTFTETFKKTMPVSDVELISLINHNGDVEINSWEKSNIEIIAHKKIRTSEDDQIEKLFEMLEIIISDKDNELLIETRHPRSRSFNDGFFGWLFAKEKTSFSVDYEIRIPHKMDLNINTTNGHIEAFDLNGRLRLETTNGNISAENIDGLVKGYTTNGSIKIRIDTIPLEDNMKFHSTNGSIKLHLPASISGYIDLETTNGHIECEFPLESRERWRKTHIRGKLGDGATDISCSTTNGNIYLYRND